MDVVGIFVAADSDHVSIEAFADTESVFAEGIAFPFGERVDYFCRFARLLDIEGDRTLHSVEVVVETGVGADEQRRGNAAQEQALGQEILEEILDGLDRDLRLVKIKGGFIVLGNK